MRAETTPVNDRVPLGDGGTFIAVFVPLLPDGACDLLLAYKREAERRGAPFVVTDDALVDPTTIPVVLLAVPAKHAQSVMARFSPPLTELPTEQVLTNYGRSHRRSGAELTPGGVSLAFDIALECKRAETEHRA